jgi:hypothetical protein
MLLFPYFEIGCPVFIMCVQVQLQEGEQRGFGGFAEELETGLFRGTVAFAGVAFGTGCYEIQPVGLPSPGAWKHVIECKISVCAAVLAEEVIAPQHVVPAERYTVVGYLNVVLEPNDRWDRV